jgi:hypothetical protein
MTPVIPSPRAKGGKSRWLPGGDLWHGQHGAGVPGLLDDATPPPGDRNDASRQDQEVPERETGDRRRESPHVKSWRSGAPRS